MIRQAISCDICGAEKQQTNHWFVASDMGGELRVSAWSSRNRLRAGAKHLCGQTCLHKLVDEFVARNIAGRLPSCADAAQESGLPLAADTSVAAGPLQNAAKPSPRPTPSLLPAVPIRPVLSAAVPAASEQPLLVAELPKPLASVPRIDETPNYSSRRSCAEAWERERVRELRAGEPARRRRSF